MSNICREPEQLSLFTLDGSAVIPCSENNTVAFLPTPVNVTAAVTKKKTASKSSLPNDEAFKMLLTIINRAVADKDARAIFGLAKIDMFAESRYCAHWQYNRVTYKSWRFIDTKTMMLLPAPGNDISHLPTLDPISEGWDDHDREYRIKNYCLNLAYVCGDTADVVVIPVEITFRSSRHAEVTNDSVVIEMSSKKPFFPTKLIPDLYYVQEPSRIHEIVSEKKPWLIAFLREHIGHGFNLNSILAFPWLEILYKAGYAKLVEPFCCRPNYGRKDERELEPFNRLCKAGSRPKDIFKCSKAMYTAFKGFSDLRVLDSYRKLEKAGKLTSDTIQIALDQDWSVKEVDAIATVLNKRYNGKPVFTFTTLVNKLNRLNMYEALDAREAIPLLNDYLNMCCNTLNIPPRIDSDSLKREHDIVARLCRETYNERQKQKMAQAEQKLQQEISEGNSCLARGDYKENIYFVRRISDYDELLDEAIQQDNCVASYAGLIAEGKSRIFTMRETAHPEKSLVTIELSPDCRTIRQKYLAHNQVIRNKSISDFIERWHRQMLAA